MSQLIAQLEQSIIDHYFSRAEKKSLKTLLQSARLNKDDLSAIKNTIYSLAKSNANEENYKSIFKWLQEVTELIDSVVDSNEKVYFSPGIECRDAIIMHLRKATSTIKICVFTISDDIIVDAIQKMHRKGIKIQIITDNDKTFDRGSDIEELANNGVLIKIDTTRAHMHHKFVVVDDEIVITGSYNWTRSAAERNHENIVVLNKQSIVNSYINEFNHLWEQMAAY